MIQVTSKFTIIHYKTEFSQPTLLIFIYSFL